MEALKDIYWFCVEMVALMFFVVFAVTMMFIFWITDFFRKEENNGKHRKKY